MWYDNLFQVPLDIGGGSKKNKRRLAEFKNLVAFQLAFKRFCEDALDRYDFDGLPDTVNKRVVLQSLLWHGNVVFFEKDGAIFALPGAPSGEFNIYGDPVNAWIFSINGLLNENVELYIHGSDENAFLTKTFGGYKGRYKGVIVWENRLRMPFIQDVIDSAEKVSDSYRTLDCIRQNIKSPSIFICEESVVNTVKKYLEDRENNIDSVISSGVFDPSKVSVIPYDSKGTQLNDIVSLIEWYESKFREKCGIKNNANMDKKGENLIEAEVSVNDEYTEKSVEKCIECMQECLDDVNKIFGTSITVKKKEVEVDEGVQGDSGADTLSRDGKSEPQSNNI